MDKEAVKTALCWSLGISLLFAIVGIEMRNKTLSNLTLAQVLKINSFMEEQQAINKELIQGLEKASRQEKHIEKLKMDIAGLELKHQGNLLRFKDIDYQLHFIIRGGE